MHIVARQTAILPVLAAGLACAQDGVDFRELDHDGDGRLSPAEWRAADASMAFDDVDTNRDGYLSSAEVKAALQIQARDTGATSPGGAADASPAQAPLSPAAASDVEHQPRRVDMYDANDDGRVSRDESFKDGELEAAFVVWDTDDDGYLDGAELAQGTAGQQSLRKHDRNGDGHMDPAEWTASGLPAGFGDADANGDGRVDAAEWNEGYPWQVNEFDDTAPTSYGASDSERFDAGADGDGDGDGDGDK